MSDPAPMSFRHAMIPMAGLCLLMACMPAPPPDTVARGHFPALEAARVPAPSDAPKNSCWARDTSPAVIETVTAQVIVQPAILNDDGSVRSPAIYATETRQEIVEPRREHVFQTLCAGQVTPELLASLQRALAARGLYDGAISGVISRDTEIALRRYQKSQGIDTGLLTIRTARELGLVAVERPA